MPQGDDKGLGKQFLFLTSPFAFCLALIFTSSFPVPLVKGFGVNLLTELDGSSADRRS